ncbi:hypothetical protein [Parabacteroides pacaensis]|uniref:hypothetical protein n=1 Tax=Parabacteroides pacaensis TaxID=2086575 RepID=UPI000D0ECB0D|nr:hypothetical protein [Parabacteroides pacaensis]
MGISGKEILIDLVYASYGRVQKESLPFYGSSASAWKNTSYDTYDRPLGITESSGRKKALDMVQECLFMLKMKFKQINILTKSIM